MADKHTDTCLQKAGDNEPIFVLRAQDTLAPEVVRTWAAIANSKGVPFEKVGEALNQAARMEEWAASNASKIPD